MLTPFDQIPGTSKIWIFPSSRKFYPQEIDEINTNLVNFLSTWSKEDAIKNVAFEIRYDRFIIVAAENNNENISLEAHDTLTQFIQELEQKYEVLLLDKINVCFKQGPFVQYKELTEFKKLIKSKGVSKKTIVFDNMILDKESLEYDWEINIMDSWMSRFF